MNDWTENHEPDDTPPDYASLTDWSRAERYAHDALRLLDSPAGPHLPHHLDQAASLLRAAIDINPDQPSWHVHLAAALSRRGDHTAAADALHTALRLEPDRPDITLSLARELLLAARHRESLNTLASLLAQHPDFEPAYCLKIEVLVELKRYSPAEETYYHARTLTDHCPRCDLAIARGLLASGSAHRAVPLLERLPDPSPEHRLLLAQACHHAGNLDRSAAVYSQLLNSAAADVLPPTERAAAWTACAAVLARLRRHSDALAALQHAIIAHPDSAAAHAQLAQFHLATGRPDEALSAARTALRCDPTLSGLHLLIARAALDAAPPGHVPQEARHHLRRELAVLSDSDPAGLLQLALLLDRSRRPTLALRVLRRLVSLAPASVGAWQNLAVVCFKLRRFDEALEASFSGLRLAPGHTDLLHNLALAHARKRDFVSAESYARLAADADPKDPEPARILMRLRVASLRRALRAFFSRR